MIFLRNSLGLDMKTNSPEQVDDFQIQREASCSLLAATVELQPFLLDIPFVGAILSLKLT